MILLCFLKSRGQVGDRNILGRSSNGSLTKEPFGLLRDFTACFSLSISVLTCESMIVEGSLNEYDWIEELAKIGLFWPKM